MTLHVWDKTHHGRTQNVSRGGLCADLTEPIAVGTELEVEIQLVFDSGGREVHSESLRLAARVAWCTTVDEAHQVGLMFLPVDAELTKHLTTFLRHLDDGTAEPLSPARGQASIDDRFG